MRDKKTGKGAIILNLDKSNICGLRAPEFAPGYINQPIGKPAYALNPPNSSNGPGLQKPNYGTTLAQNPPLRIPAYNYPPTPSPIPVIPAYIPKTLQ